MQNASAGAYAYISAVRAPPPPLGARIRSRSGRSPAPTAADKPRKMLARTAFTTGRRGFAKAAAKKAAKGKLPKELYGVHGRYASALFLSAQSSKNLDKVEKELNVSLLFFVVGLVGRCRGPARGWIQLLAAVTDLCGGARRAKVSLPRAGGALCCNRARGGGGVGERLVAAAGVVWLRGASLSPHDDSPSQRVRNCPPPPFPPVLLVSLLDFVYAHHSHHLIPTRHRILSATSTPTLSSRHSCPTRPSRAHTSRRTLRPSWPRGSFRRPRGPFSASWRRMAVLETRRRLQISTRSSCARTAVR